MLVLRLVEDVQTVCISNAHHQSVPDEFLFHRSIFTVFCERVQGEDILFSSLNLVLYPAVKSSALVYDIMFNFRERVELCAERTRNHEIENDLNYNGRSSIVHTLEYNFRLPLR